MNTSGLSAPASAGGGCRGVSDAFDMLRQGVRSTRACHGAISGTEAPPARMTDQICRRCTTD